uniref:Putative salivary serpin n=1 Tax=Aedes albopictus TaxID=7160 RepID=Q5MIW4_AEDAL|nr:putative salivary serpin [Aedes albopictus]
MCSTGLCLVFFIAQAVFLMNYSEQQTTVVMENGAISEKETNVDEVMTQFIMKFYTKRFVEGQNLVVAPLLIFRVFMSMYGEMDASAKFDLHSLVGIPQEASAEKMSEFEAFANKYALPVGVQRNLVETRLYYDKSIGKIRSSLEAKSLKPFPTNFADKQTFCNEVNTWIRNTPINGTDDLVHDYYLNNETAAFVAGALSIDWNMQLKTSSDVKAFEGENVKFLEGSISTRYAKLDNLKVEVVEMVTDNLSGVKLWLIMPDEASSIKKFNDQLSIASIRQIEKGLTALQKEDVALTVPMVTIEYNSQEDAYVTEVFEVFSSLFSKPAVKPWFRVSVKDDLYAVKNFLMKCILRFVGSDAPADSKGQSTEKAVSFNRPFVMMILSKESNVPILLANYFSPKDKLRALEAKERHLRMKAKEHLDL